MINSRWCAQIVDGARHHYAHDPEEKIEINEPRFKGRLHGNHVRFQQGKHRNEKNAGKHVRNQLCHTLKIIQSNGIDVNSLKKHSQNKTSLDSHLKVAMRTKATKAYKASAATERSHSGMVEP